MYSQFPRSSTELRSKFSKDGVETASNARIITLCYDRLDRDLLEARNAIAAGDHYASNNALAHAQDLIGAMAEMVDVTMWDHSGSLLAVYDYLLRLLAVANAEKADSLVAQAQQLVEELGEAFRTAAATASSTATQAAAEPGTEGSDPAPRVSVQA